MASECFVVWVGFFNIAQEVKKEAKNKGNWERHLLDLGKDLGLTEENELLVIDLDSATAIGGQKNLVALLELRGDDLSLLFRKR